MLSFSFILPARALIRIKVIISLRFNHISGGAATKNIRNTIKDSKLTAGKAKNEIPRRAKPAESIRPVHVFGVLSP